MRASDLATLARYNAWANRRLLRRVAGLERRALQRRSWLSQGNLLATLVHILDAQWYWRTGLETGNLPSETIVPDDFRSIAALRRRWKEEDRLLVAYVEGLSDRQVSRPIRYRWGRARPRRRTLWHVVVHIINHGTHHRAEVGAYLATLDRSPGDLDFVRFVKAT